MRRIIIAIVVAVAAMAAVSSAQARDIGFYALTDADYVNVKGNNLYGFDVGGGYAFSKHTDIEASYTRLYLGSLSSNAGSLELVARVPLTNWYRLGLYGDLGAEYVSGLANAKWGARGGAGIQFGLIDNISVRIGARYRTAIQKGVQTNAGLVIPL